MGTTAKLTFEDYEKLPEREGPPYELDEGELLLPGFSLSLPYVLDGNRK